MTQNRLSLTIEELAGRVGVPVRTIRYYIAEGLLPGPQGRGRAATYGEDHLLRLRLIRRLSERRVPLAQVRTRLAGLSRGELEGLLVEEDRYAAELAQAGREASAKPYVSMLLHRARALGEPHPFSAEPGRQACPCRGSPAPAAAPLRAEAWRRWELAPGVELHVSVGAGLRERELIERLLRAAGLALQKGER